MLVENRKKASSSLRDSYPVIPLRDRLSCVSRMALLLGALSTLWLTPAYAAAAPSVAVGTSASHSKKSTFEERRADLLQKAAGYVSAGDTPAGSLYDITAALHLGVNLEAANVRLAQLLAAPPSGNMFWMYQMVMLMAAGQGRLSVANEQRFGDLWRTYWPSRGDTENHWLMYYASLRVVSQLRPNRPPADWFNGRSSEENAAEAGAYIREWIRVTTTQGQGEYDSPGYIGEYVVPLALLAGWEADPERRDEARRMLDYLFFDYAVDQINGQYAGAHSRVYPRQILLPGATTGSALGWLAFGVGERMQNAQAVVLATSGYTPPPVLGEIAHGAGRPYVNLERKRTRWRIRHAGPEALRVGDRLTHPVYKYSYVHPDFILGSSQGGLLQPIQQQTWNLRWRVENTTEASNSFFTVQPHSSPYEGSMYFTFDWDSSTDVIARSKVDYDSPDKLASGSPYEQVFQEGPALVGLYQIPPGARFPHLLTLFSRDLQDVVEDPSGWIFARGGPVYVAYRPFVAGEWRDNDWTGLLRGGAGAWISAGFESWGSRHRVLISEAPRNGYVVQVAPVREHASYAAFQSAIRALPLRFRVDRGPEVEFTTLSGRVLSAVYGETPKVDGRPLNYAAWPLFGNPFAHEKVGSGRLNVRHAGEGFSSDFTSLAEPEGTKQP